MNNVAFKTYIRSSNYFPILIVLRMLYILYLIVSHLKKYYFQQYYIFYNIGLILNYRASSFLTIMLLKMISNNQLSVLTICFQSNYRIIFCTNEYDDFYLLYNTWNFCTYSMHNNIFSLSIQGLL